jgi:hypothetical protein
VSEKLWKLSVKENRYLPMVTPQIKSEIIRAIEDLQAMPPWKTQWSGFIFSRRLSED